MARCSFFFCETALVWHLGLACVPSECDHRTAAAACVRMCMFVLMDIVYLLVCVHVCVFMHRTVYCCERAYVLVRVCPASFSNLSASVAW